MSYERVLPRDLFNDANLLKCIGQITLLIHDRRLELEVNHRHPNKDFQIRQSEDDGSTQVTNITFALRSGWAVQFYRPMNARSSWPLYALVADSQEEIEVFDDHGNLTEEFLKAVEWGHTHPLNI